VEKPLQQARKRSLQTQKPFMCIAVKNFEEFIFLKYAQWQFILSFDNNTAI
jgi:hypothetical protein